MVPDSFLEKLRISIRQKERICYNMVWRLRIEEKHTIMAIGAGATKKFVQKSCIPNGPCEKMAGTKVRDMDRLLDHVDEMIERKE